MLTQIVCSTFLLRMIYGSFLLLRSQSKNKCYEALDTPSWKVLSATILLATSYMSRTVCRPLSLLFLICSPGKVNLTNKLAQLMKNHQELKSQHSPLFCCQPMSPNLIKRSSDDTGLGVIATHMHDFSVCVNICNYISSP